MEVKLLSYVQLFGTTWTVAYQAPLSMGFFSQEYWSGMPFPSPWDLPYPRIKPWSPTLQEDTIPFEPPGKPLSYSQLGMIYFAEDIFKYLLKNLGKNS